MARAAVEQFQRPYCNPKHLSCQLRLKIVEKLVCIELVLKQFRTDSLRGHLVCQKHFLSVQTLSTFMNTILGCLFLQFMSLFMLKWRWLYEDRDFLSQKLAT